MTRDLDHDWAPLLRCATSERKERMRARCPSHPDECPPPPPEASFALQASVRRTRRGSSKRSAAPDCADARIHRGALARCRPPA